MKGSDVDAEEQAEKILLATYWPFKCVLKLF